MTNTAQKPAKPTLNDLIAGTDYEKHPEAYRISFVMHHPAEFLMKFEHTGQKCISHYHQFIQEMLDDLDAAGHISFKIHDFDDDDSPYDEPPLTDPRLEDIANYLLIENGLEMIGGDYIDHRGEIGGSNYLRYIIKYQER